MPAWDVQEPRARQSDPETSHEAAARVIDRQHLQNYILLTISRHGGSTDSDLAFVLTNWGVRHSPSGLRTRRAELVKMGKVKDSGERRVLPTGRKSIVWELVPE